MKPKSQPNDQVLKEMAYECQIDITFPTVQQALHAKEVLQVDGEIGDQICKSFDVIDSSNGNNGNDGNNGNGDNGGEVSGSSILSL